MSLALGLLGALALAWLGFSLAGAFTIIGACRRYRELGP